MSQPQGDPRELEKRLHDSVLKIDHFEGIDRLKLTFTGVPNWRQMGSLNVFGSAQPTLTGLESVIKHYRDNCGVEKVLWINMRSEPVVYVKNNSFAPRSASNPKENLEIEGFSIDQIMNAEKYLIENILKPLLKENHCLKYFQDTYSLIPEDRIDSEHKLEDVDEQKLLTVSEAYQNLNKSSSIPIELVRVPINDVPNERVPALEDFDTLVDTVRTRVTSKTAIHCNCQMGRGRTTSGMFLCALIASKQHKVPLETESFSKESVTPESGYYSFVNDLIKLMPEAKIAKNEIDCLICMCDHLINMRGFIWKCKHDYEEELTKNGGKESNRSFFWLNLAINYVERYVYFILFAVYLTQAQTNPNIVTSFKQWCIERNDVFVRILGRNAGSQVDEMDPSKLRSFRWQS